MQKDFNEIKFLFQPVEDMDAFIHQNVSEPFSDGIVNFLDTLSYELLKDMRNYSEVAALAFFFRRSNILRLKKKYDGGDSLRQGRGIVFHIAPSNVPLNFAYSLIIGILSGNINIVRVPSVEFEQINIFCDALTRVKVQNEHDAVIKRIVLVRYNKKSAATAYFSSICDVRIIWGGNETISQIRKYSISERAFDVTFGDRFSICVINADVYIEGIDSTKIANSFYNDTYLFDQNACTSPHLIIWLGSKENVEQAKIIFWNELHKVVIAKYSAVQPIIAIDKLTTFYTQALGKSIIRKVTTPNNHLWRVELKELKNDIDIHRCAGGYFSEYHAGSLVELNLVINKTYQTMAYYGIAKSDLMQFVKKNRLIGIDRIVPIGRTSEFSITWDGFELITTLTRTIEII